MIEFDILKSILADLRVPCITVDTDDYRELRVEYRPPFRTWLKYAEDDKREGRWHVGSDGYTSIAGAVYAFVCNLTYTRYLDDGRIIHADRDRTWDAYHRLCPAEHKVAPIEYR